MRHIGNNEEGAGLVDVSRTIDLTNGHSQASASADRLRRERVYSCDLELLGGGNLHFLRVDDELLELFDYSLAELQADGWTKLILPRDAERIAKIIRIVSDGGLWTGRIRVRSRTGTITVFALHVEPELIDDRTLVRAILRDVTDAALASIPLQETDGSSPTLVVGDLTIDPDGYIVKKRGKEIPLTITEFKLLLQFVHEPGRVLTQNELAERVWGHEFVSTSNVPMAVKRLRDKIEDDPRDPTMIETVRGIGYRMRGPGA